MYKQHILNIYNICTNHIPTNEIFIDHLIFFTNLSSFLENLYIFCHNITKKVGKYTKRMFLTQNPAWLVS